MKRNNPIAKMYIYMQNKIDVNDHKEGWRGYPPKTWFRRITQELGELRRAIDKKEPPEEIWKESADVANFAMMIADCYEIEYEDDKSDKEE